MLEGLKELKVCGFRVLVLRPLGLQVVSRVQEGLGFRVKGLG